MGTKRIKWTTNGVSFARGNYTPLIAKLDNSRVWLELRAWCTAHTFREEIRRLAQDFGAKEVEIKPEFTEDENGQDHLTEKNVIGFHYIDEKASFAIDLPVPEGARRKIKFYKPEDIFIETE